MCLLLCHVAVSWSVVLCAALWYAVLRFCCAVLLRCAVLSCYEVLRYAMLYCFVVLYLYHFLIARMIVLRYGPGQSSVRPYVCASKRLPIWCQLSISWTDRTERRAQFSACSDQEQGHTHYALIWEISAIPCPLCVLSVSLEPIERKRKFFSEILNVFRHKFQLAWIKAKGTLSHYDHCVWLKQVEGNLS